MAFLDPRNQIFFFNFFSEVCREYFRCKNPVDFFFFNLGSWCEKQFKQRLFKRSIKYSSIV